MRQHSQMTSLLKLISDTIIADDLKQIVFDEISEKYTSKDYHYVVGKVNLTHLIANRDYILKNNLFISSS
jgi:hypothetical protein